MVLKRSIDAPRLEFDAWLGLFYNNGPSSRKGDCFCFVSHRLTDGGIFRNFAQRIISIIGRKNDGVTGLR
jgi:hypothetical protein